MTRSPIITDHAMLRYLERVIGIDVDLHRRAVEAIVAQGVARGACAVVVGGHRYAIVDCHVVTVKPVRTEVPRGWAHPVDEREARRDDGF